jgi:hypothetical protein
MRLAIIGSRTFTDYELLKQEVSKLGDIEEIISGGARGADSLGIRYAKENNITSIEYLPDWEEYGKSAGFRRNIDIVNVADFVLAFWDGKSKGTKHALDFAEKSGKDSLIILFKTKESE